MTWLNDAEVETAEEKTLKQNETSRLQSKAARDAELENITFTTSGGGVIQCREKDETRLRRKLNRMLKDGETETFWIGVDNKPTTVTVEDFENALVHGEDEVARIFELYMVTL